MGDSLAKGLDTGSRAILTACGADIDVGGTVKAALNIIVDLDLLDHTGYDDVWRDMCVPQGHPLCER